MSTSSARRFRVRVAGGGYCTLSFLFHELGVCIPDAPDCESAHVFNNRIAANYAIGRTQEAIKSVEASMYPDFPKFKPLRFKGSLEVEEFLVEAPATA